MKLFGYEIRKVPPLKDDPLERLKGAVDEINDAWTALAEAGDKARPWIIWEEQRVVLSRYNGRPEIIHE